MLSYLPFMFELIFSGFELGWFGEVGTFFTTVGWGKKFGGLVISHKSKRWNSSIGILLPTYQFQRKKEVGRKAATVGCLQKPKEFRAAVLSAWRKMLAGVLGVFTAALFWGSNFIVTKKYGKFFFGHLR